MTGIIVTWLDGRQETFQVTTYGTSDGQLNLYQYRRHGDQQLPLRRMIWSGRFRREARQVAWDELLNEWHIPLAGVRDWKPVHGEHD